LEKACAKWALQGAGKSRIREVSLMGFFAWLREGVRRAVLLGFSDAIAEIGSRSEQEDIGPHLASAFQQSVQDQNGAVRAPAPSTNVRKRLGKSLAQLSEAAQA
jgi:hypothetical protein